MKNQFDASSMGKGFWVVLAVAIAISLFHSISRLLPESSKEQQTPYFDIKTSRSVLVVPGEKADIKVFFWYGCAHCKAAAAVINEYARQRGDTTVEYRHTAIPKWLPEARLFYAMHTLYPQKAQQATPLLMDKYPAGGWLGDDIRIGDKLTDLLKSLDMDPARIEQALDSPAVDEELSAQAVVERVLYVREVPFIIVDGRKAIITERLENGWNSLPPVFDSIFNPTMPGVRNRRTRSKESALMLSASSNQSTT